MDLGFLSLAKDAAQRAAATTRRISYPIAAREARAEELPG